MLITQHCTPLPLFAPIDTANRSQYFSLLSHQNSGLVRFFFFFFFVWWLRRSWPNSWRGHSRCKRFATLPVGEWLWKLTVSSRAVKSSHILAANFSHPERDLTYHQFCQHKVVAGAPGTTQTDQLAFQPKRLDYIEFILLLYRAHFPPERRAFCKRSQMRHSTSRDCHWLLDLCPSTHSLFYYPDLQELRSRKLIHLSSNEKS